MARTRQIRRPLSDRPRGPQLRWGGGHDSPTNTPEIESLARFALENYSKNQKALLVFQKVLKARGYNCAGASYDITIEVEDGGIKKHFFADVWVKPWMNWKTVTESYLVDDAGNEVGDGGDNSSLNPTLEAPITRARDRARAKRMKASI